MEDKTIEHPSADSILTEKITALVLNSDPTDTGNQEFIDYATELLSRYHNNPPQSDQQKLRLYFPLFFILSYGPKDLPERQSASEILAQLHHQNVEAVDDFHNLTDATSSAILGYFDHSKVPSGYSVASDTDDSFVNQMINLANAKTLQETRRRYAFDQSPEKVIEQVKVPDHEIDTIWMSKSGLKPDIQLLTGLAQV